MTQEIPQPAEILPPLVKREDGLYSYTDKATEETYFTLVNEWVNDAKAKHASAEQTPTALPDGLGLHFNKISLYHGGGTAGIIEFNNAEDTTAGEGAYATSMADQAFGYAVVRARDRIKHGNVISLQGPEPVVYELEQNDVSFLDLRTRDNLATTMLGFKDHLAEWLKNREQATDLTWLNELYMDIVKEKIQMIIETSGYVPKHKKVLQQTGGLFTDYVTNTLGYDGTIVNEGGEGGYTGKHDSWVLMHPEQAKVTRETSFITPNVFDGDAWNEQLAKMDRIAQNFPSLRK